MKRAVEMSLREKGELTACRSNELAIERKDLGSVGELDESRREGGEEE